MTLTTLTPGGSCSGAAAGALSLSPHPLLWLTWPPLFSRDGRAVGCGKAARWQAALSVGSAAMRVCAQLARARTLWAGGAGYSCTKLRRAACSLSCVGGRTAPVRLACSLPCNKLLAVLTVTAHSHAFSPRAAGGEAEGGGVNRFSACRTRSPDAICIGRAWHPARGRAQPGGHNAAAIAA
jgi:hypothetical protein